MEEHCQSSERQSYTWLILMLLAPMKSAHYIAKPNSNHSIGFSTGLSITVMLSGAMVIPVLLCL